MLRVRSIGPSCRAVVCSLLGRLTLELRNPHSIVAALRLRPDGVERIVLPSGRPSDSWSAIGALARDEGIPVLSGPDPAGRDRPAGRRGHRKGSQANEKARRDGVAHAFVEERRPLGLEAVLAGAGSDRPGLWLALDSIQDPRNVGAIFRSAAFFGVRGLVMAEDRAAPLSAVSYDTASGGLEAVPFAVETNLRRALSAAKEAGIWILGSSEHAPEPAADVPRDRDWLVVVGNEERGLRRLTLEACDAVCAIAPGPGPAEAPRSLNVSVATGILLAMLSRPTQ